MTIITLPRHEIGGTGKFLEVATQMVLLAHRLRTNEFQPTHLGMFEYLDWHLESGIGAIDVVVSDSWTPDEDVILRFHRNIDALQFKLRWF